MSVLDRNDVDTDQIIPKQFLKRVERTGFGEFLFHDWAKAARLGPARATRSSRPGATSAAARRASTPPGRSRTTASRRSSRPASRTSSTRNCTKIGLLPVVLAEADVKELMAAGHARIDLEEQEVSFAGRQVAVRDRPRDRAPPARGPRRHRRDAPAVATRSTRYEAERERSGPGHRRRWHEPRDWNAASYDRVSTPAGGDGRGRCSTGCRSSGDETVLDAGCGSRPRDRAAARPAAARARGGGRLGARR